MPLLCRHLLLKTAGGSIVPAVSNGLDRESQRDTLHTHRPQLWKFPPHPKLLVSALLWLCFKAYIDNVTTSKTPKTESVHSLSLRHMAKVNNWSNIRRSGAISEQHKQFSCWYATFSVSYLHTETQKFICTHPRYCSPSPITVPYCFHYS